ncbi:hypothetical protein [Robertmurraya andreesenii]|uniref:Uncharacterized protein n=1 Tax=Anoxybacillus andreesenii TaxID=1325932 RepID=A0ABT9V6T2_9BACL|nr:hypothetical protein [Robertmurraya andreesenii]MDQ0156655.1 hypothetical protein [Robertmurraya andreesenii]
MGPIFNRWSFYLLFMYLGFVLLLASNSIRTLILKWIGIHPLKILFYFNLIILLLGIIGFTGIEDWKAVLRSVFTVGLTMVLTLFLVYILFVGNLRDL